MDLLLAIFAALGLLLLLWCLFGAILLPADGWGRCVLRESGAVCRQVRALAFLQGCGLLRLTVYVILREAPARPELQRLAERHRGVVLLRQDEFEAMEEKERRVSGT